MVYPITVLATLVFLFYVNTFLKRTKMAAVDQFGGKSSISYQYGSEGKNTLKNLKKTYTKTQLIEGLKVDSMDVLSFIIKIIYKSRYLTTYNYT